MVIGTDLLRKSFQASVRVVSQTFQLRKEIAPIISLGTQTKGL